MSSNAQRTYGAHHLAFEGTIPEGQGDLLKQAAATASAAGCTLFELACQPLMGLTATQVADALQEGGMNEASFCRFYPVTPEGAMPFGDPISDSDDAVSLALKTVEADMQFITGLRQGGIKVVFYTGPKVFGLGKNYGLSFQVLDARILKFYKQALDLYAEDIKDVLEYLRPGEDEDVLAGIDRTCGVLDAIGDPRVLLHGDIFHMLCRGEDPAETIRKAGNRLGYLHTHGNDRVYPGAPEDRVNWAAVAAALNEIGYTGPIVSEPFGHKVREEIPPLGEGLPPAVPADEYYTEGKKTLVEAGILAA